MSDVPHFRIIKPLYTDSRVNEGRMCAKRGCVKRTTKGKPYCLIHVTAMPYVAALRAEMTARDVEELLPQARVDLDGVAAREALHRIDAAGKLTVRSLARAINAPLAHTRRIVRALVRRKMARVARLKGRPEYETVELIA